MDSYVTCQKDLFTLYFVHLFLFFIMWRGVEQLAARQAHNLEVVGSSPTPATKNLLLF